MFALTWQFIICFPFKGISSSSEGEDEASDEPSTRRATRKGREVNLKLDVLKKKHVGKWPDFKLRAWANMLVRTAYLKLPITNCFPSRDGLNN